MVACINKLFGDEGWDLNQNLLAVEDWQSWVKFHRILRIIIDIVPILLSLLIGLLI